ncbi:MAG TPA: phosphatidate cytidylyltransferase [Actinomycetota bacterium]|nr:phosphatidate cytidylyltransferase [Actinomycetota bacterium]
MDAAPQPPGAAAAADRPRSLKAAVGFGIVLAVVVIASLLISPLTFFLFAAVVLLVAQAELYAVLKASGYAPAAMLGLVCGAVLLASTYVWGPLALALSLTLPVPLLLVWAVTVPVERVRSTIASTYLGVVYGPFLAGFAVLLLREEHGRALIVAFVGMTAVLDSGAYLVGRKLGRHRMAPRTSPKKSWEGFLGGSLITVGLSALVLPLFEPFDVSLAVRLAIVMSLVSPMGDLAESLVKRDLGVKDMGTLLPGHGGAFDRVDSIVYSAPVAYFVLVTLGWAQ